MILTEQQLIQLRQLKLFMRFLANLDPDNTYQYTDFGAPHNEPNNYSAQQIKKVHLKMSEKIINLRLKG